MLKIIDQFFGIKKIRLIAVIRDGLNLQYQSMLCGVEKSGLKLINVQRDLTQEELLSLTQKKTPVLLLLDGKGVLHKSIQRVDESEMAWFKNLDFDTLHFTSYQTDEHLFISFCRKAILDETLSLFETNELTVLGVYVGSISGILAAPILAKPIYKSNFCTVKINDNKPIFLGISEIEENKEEHNIDEQFLNSFHISLLGAAVDYFSGNSTIEKSKIKQAAEQEFIYKKAFEKIGICVLLFFLLSLMGSYISTQIIISENAELLLANKLNGKTISELRMLETEFETKSQIYREMGIASKKYYSFYCYKITSSTPNAIRLKKLELNPVKSEIKPGKKIELDVNSIIIEGQTIKERELNSWIGRLKTEKWIKKIEISSVKKQKKGGVEFKLKITAHRV